MLLNAQQIKIMMMIRKESLTGYQVQKRTGVAHQLIYRMLNILKVEGILKATHKKNDGKPDSIIYSHQLNEAAQKELVGASIIAAAINPSTGYKELEMISACIGFVDDEVAKEWLIKFTELQQKMICEAVDRESKFDVCSKYEVKTRKFLLDEAVALAALVNYSFEHKKLTVS